jgi:hypothetical protein
MVRQDTLPAGVETVPPAAEAPAVPARVLAVDRRHAPKDSPALEPSSPTEGRSVAGPPLRREFAAVGPPAVVVPARWSPRRA